jgi:hypothetical protein
MNVLSSLLPGVADSFDNDEVSLGSDLGSNTKLFDLANFMNIQLMMHVLLQVLNRFLHFFILRSISIDL